MEGQVWLPFVVYDRNGDEYLYISTEKARFSAPVEDGMLIVRIHHHGGETDDVHIFAPGFWTRVQALDEIDAMRKVAKLKAKLLQEDRA